MTDNTRLDHEAQMINNLRLRLTEAYQGRHTQQKVVDVVNDAFHSFDQAPIRDFVPLLVEHIARDHLRYEGQGGTP